MIYVVGAGPGALDLITVRGKDLIERCDCLIYAGSLVSPDFLSLVRPDCQVYDSSKMTLDDVMAVMQESERRGWTLVRLHTGDPSLYGAIQEQFRLLEKAGIPYEQVPGVSSFQAAAAALKLEYTLPDVSQTLILTRMAGRTSVPSRESLKDLASHGTSMAIFLSIGNPEGLQKALLDGGAYGPETPVAVVYRASWPDQKIVRATLGTFPEAVRAQGITRQALLLVGDCLLGVEANFSDSKLYAPDFSTAYRQAKGWTEEPDSGGTRVGAGEGVQGCDRMTDGIAVREETSSEGLSGLDDCEDTEGTEDVPDGGQGGLTCGF